MTKSVFYSFHCDNDSWRVQQVINMGAIEGQPLLEPQEWEEVKKKGSPAIEEWIDAQMSDKEAVVVLIGSETAERAWVDYEIRKAWNSKKPLVGIYIHGLADPANNTSQAGADPFAMIALEGGGTIADYVEVINPDGSSSKEVHADIKANIAAWVDKAYVRT